MRREAWRRFWLASSCGAWRSLRALRSLRRVLQVLRQSLRLDPRLGEDIMMGIAALMRLEALFLQTEIATHNMSEETVFWVRQRMRLRPRLAH